MMLNARCVSHLPLLALKRHSDNLQTHAEFARVATARNKLQFALSQSTPVSILRPISARLLS